MQPALLAQSDILEEVIVPQELHNSLQEMANHVKQPLPTLIEYLLVCAVDFYEGNKAKGLV